MLPVSPASAASLAKLMAQARQDMQQGQATRARAGFEKVLALAPGHAEAHVFLSTLCWEAADLPAFETHMSAALAAAPSSARLWQAAAERYGKMHRTDQAIAAYDQWSALDPKAVTPKAEKARYLQVLGRFDDADAILRTLLKRHPEQTDLYRLALSGRRLPKGDPVVRQMLRLWKDPRLNDIGRMNLGFGIARAMEEQGRDDKVFTFLDQANMAQARLAPYAPEKRHEEVEGALAAQSGDILPSSGCADLRPVFVTGMPRSGTTLVEQIIAAHSAATDGGELVHGLKLAYQRFGVPPKMRALHTVSDAELQAYRDHYLRLVHRDSGAQSGVVTDKSIQSFLIYGLLYRALPGARFIAVLRDPRDIALSIYKNQFALGTHRYASDLASIAREIQLFRSCIAHWKQRLPGVIHEVRYEDLVSDPEPQARALVAAAGLDWQDQCLSFHEKKGAVQTLSLAQVRQPIHAGRREAWRRYEAQLQPFIDAWGDEPWD